MSLDELGLGVVLIQNRGNLGAFEHSIPNNKGIGIYFFACDLLICFYYEFLIVKLLS